jgi:phosphatidylglycerophosphate synthase
MHVLQHNQSDWTNVSPKDRNSWQRLAAATRGIVALGNFVTIVGLLVALFGMYKIYRGDLVLGVLLVGVGRFADVLDGYAASLTKTKSKVGEGFDAASDKLIVLAAFGVFLARHIVPTVPLVLIFLHNALNVSLSIVARHSGKELHPSKSGKYATFLEWLTFLSFVAAKLIGNHSVFLADLCLVIGYILFVVTCIPAIDSTIGYFKRILQTATPTENYNDYDGVLKTRISSIFRMYWRKKWLVWVSSFVCFVFLLSVYLLAACPYSSDTFAESPFTTRYEQGRVVLVQDYKMQVYHGWFFSSVSYIQQMVADIWMRTQNRAEPGNTYAQIVANIHSQRFDPNRPYVISGDQFEGLYIRNMGVFYQDLLDPHTALNTTDWHNRERIAIQTLAYSMAATQQLHYPVTTLSPISPRGVVAVNFWSYPSDTMYSLMQTLQTLEANPETRQAALQLQAEYGGGLRSAYVNYIMTVRDVKTGMVRSNIQLSSARDAVKRESSFYDNVILWKSEQLAAQFGFSHDTPQKLATLHQSIMSRYWSNKDGHFIDDVAPGDANSYSSDWLFALTTGFLEPSNPSDLTKLEKISDYIDKQHLASPLPIRYTNDQNQNEDFFVKYFASSYGNTAVWSYWGDLYIAFEENLYQQTGNVLYAQHVESGLYAWRRIVVQDKSYPETLTSNGKVLKTLVYESIRRNGWVVDLETDQYNWNHISDKSL